MEPVVILQILDISCFDFEGYEGTQTPVLHYGGRDFGRCRLSVRMQAQVRSREV